MIARRVVAKVTNQNIYNTEQGVYEASAALTDKGELVVNFKPRTDAPLKEEVPYITVHYTQQETNMIRTAVNGGPGPCR